MGRGLSAQTKQTVRIIRDMIDNAAGDLTPQFDDIAHVFRRETGGRHAEALRRVTASLPAALAVLEGEGWYAAKVTDYYVENFRGLTGEAKHPSAPKDLIRSVAGGGGAASAIHFCPTDNCPLIIQAYCMNASSGEGKVKATVTRMNGLAASGLLTADGITTIAGRAQLPPRKDVSAALRVAAREDQKKLGTG